jgi:hypothetical protein
MIPTLYGQSITVNFRGATGLRGSRWVATAVNPETRNYNWVSVSYDHTRSVVEQVTDAAMGWLDKCQVKPWVIVGVSQNGTDPDSYTVFTVPAYMGHGLIEIGQNTVDASKAMAAAT